MEGNWTSDQTDQLAAALVAAQDKLKNPGRDRAVKVETRAGGSYGFSYATLAGIFDEVRPVLAAAKIAILQPIRLDGDHRYVITRLIHVSGQWAETWVPILTTAEGPQAFGSAVTYARRYGLGTLLPIAAEDDDDANAAEGNKVASSEERPTPSPEHVAAKARTLGEEILKRCKGHKDAAADLLQHLTKSEPGAKKEFPGFRSISGMKQDWQVETAWKRFMALPPDPDAPDAELGS